ncbi:MAG: ABC transporter permease [Verrucomicrobia bacterium]|nr:ABC transporter permease [Verrucomicrobiota bacterium]
MLKIIIGRLLQLVPVLLILMTLTFFLSKSVPGGPFSQERQVSPEIIQKLNQYYGLDKPLWQQYLSYLGQVARFDFGPSYTYQTDSVNDVIARAFPISLQIGALAFLIALVLGTAAGVMAAVRPNTLWDYLPTGAATLGICIPTFVMGPILALFFGLTLRLAPVSGWYGLDYMPLPPVVLPAVTLGLFYSAYVARLTRGGMLEILNQDFIRTARAKGVPEWQIVFRHGLRGGLLPVVTFLGPAFAGLITGSFVVEKVFNVPGLGQEFIKSVFNRDYPLILGTVVFYGALIVLFNLTSDILLNFMDPRTRA